MHKAKVCVSVVFPTRTDNLFVICAWYITNTEAISLNSDQTQVSIPREQKCTPVFTDVLSFFHCAPEQGLVSFTKCSSVAAELHKKDAVSDSRKEPNRPSLYHFRLLTFQRRLHVMTLSVDTRIGGSRTQIFNLWDSSQWTRQGITKTTKWQCDVLCETGMVHFGFPVGLHSFEWNRPALDDLPRGKVDWTLGNSSSSRQDLPVRCHGQQRGVAHTALLLGVLNRCSQKNLH